MIPGDPGDVWTWTDGPAPAAPLATSSAFQTAINISISLVLSLIPWSLR